MASSLRRRSAGRSPRSTTTTRPMPAADPVNAHRMVPEKGTTSATASASAPNTTATSTSAESAS